MKENMKTLCGTGHRPQDLPNKFEYNWEKDILNIQRFILENDITKVITGMALGFDTALAVAVIKLKDSGHNIHLEAAIPCYNQYDSWSVDDKKLYQFILRRCDSRIVISNEYTKTCMQDRNEYMVDNADVVLAFYNGKGYGGTYNCIKYAEKVGKPVVNIYTMYNVRNNMELKKVNSDVTLEIATRETEDLLDINRQIHRLEKNKCKVMLQSPKGRILPSKALGKYTRRQVNIEIGGLRHDQVIAKFTNLKDMMSHTEYVDVPVYEEQHLEYAVPLKDDNGNIIKDKNGCVVTTFDSVPLGNELVFWHKTPKVDGNGKVITKTVEKTVYLDRIYTVTVNGEYCHNKEIKKLAKSFKVPLATVVENQVIDPDDQTYLLHDCNENVIKLIKEKYETISPEKKEMLLEFFGTHDPDISDFEDFAYAMINFKMFRVDGLPLPNKVDAVRFNNMLGAFKVPNAYDIMYDMAEKGMLVNLEDFPELKQFEEVRFYEDSYIEDDILD